MNTTHQTKAADPQARAAAILADAAKAPSPDGYTSAVILLLCNELAQAEPPPVDNAGGEFFRFVADLNPADKTSGVVCIVYRDGRYCALGGVYAGGVDVLPCLDQSARFRLEQEMEREAEVRELVV